MENERNTVSISSDTLPTKTKKSKYYLSGDELIEAGIKKFKDKNISEDKKRAAYDEMFEETEKFKKICKYWEERDENMMLELRKVLKYNHIQEKFVDYVNNIIELPTLEDIKKHILKDDQNVAYAKEIRFNNNFDYDIDDLADMLNITKHLKWGTGNLNHGEGEFNLLFFTKDAEIGIGCDANINGNNEAKGKNGMLKGQGNIEKASFFFDSFKNNLVNSGFDINKLSFFEDDKLNFSSIISIKKFIIKLKENLNIPNNVIAMYAFDSLFKQRKINNVPQNFYIFISQFRFNDINNINYFAKELIRICGVISYFCYCVSHNIKYFWLFGDKKFYVIENKLYNDISNVLWEDYLSIYNDNNLKFSKGITRYKKDSSEDDNDMHAVFYIDLK